VPARSWIRNMKTKKDLDCDWVFAGSMLVDHPFDKNKPKVYLANDGDVICVSNFETATLDVPVKSSKGAELAGGGLILLLEPLWQACDMSSTAASPPSGCLVYRLVWKRWGAA